MGMTSVPAMQARMAFFLVFLKEYTAEAGMIRLQPTTKFASSPMKGTYTIKTLAKAQRYYVNACPSTVYNDGTHVFGQNSYVKQVFIKK